MDAIPPASSRVKRALPTRDELRIVGLNLLPLAGILFFDWSVLVLLLLYWFESLVIIAFGLVQMNMALGAPDPDKVEESGGFGQSDHAGQGCVLVPFFSVFYAIMMSVHGGMLIGFFDTDDLVQDTSGLGASLAALEIVFSTSWFAALALLINHALDFKVEFLDKALKGRGLLLNGILAPLYACIPLARVFLMQVVVIVSAIFALALGMQLVPMFIFVAIKAGGELWVHRTIVGMFSDEAPPQPGGSPPDGDSPD